MKIVFVNPYCLDPRLQDYDIKVVPIGVYYMAACLIEAGHSCEILNWYDMKGRDEDMAKILRDLRPDILAVSILHANRWGGIDIAKIAKKISSETFVIFGGPGATFLWEHLLNHFPEIDAIVVGEGEETMMELVSEMDGGNISEWRNIPGLALRHNQKPMLTAKRDFIKDLDTLADPAKHFSFNHVISSRGCPWNCYFCGSPRIWERKVRFHSPSYFVSQLRRLNKKGQRFFFVSDDTFTLKKDRVISICKEIISSKMDIEWVAISRVNIVDDEILYWMRRAGCIQISYGVESGSSRIRKRLNKNISDDEITRAFEATRSYGIMPRAYFIYGSPGETKKTISESIRLMKRIKPLGAIFYILDIFPGTKLYDDFKKRTGKSDDIWLNRIEDIMYFETDDGLDEKKVLEFGKRLRTAFYSNLPSWAKNIQLKDLPELAPHQSSFLARLGLTFTYGDYSTVKAVPQKEQTAKGLFKRALTIFPNEVAYLGLAIMYQKNDQHTKAVDLLEEGLKHFPASSQLQGCLGVSLMQLGRLEEALELFLRAEPSVKNLSYAYRCAYALGNMHLCSRIANKLKSLEKTVTKSPN